MNEADIWPRFERLTKSCTVKIDNAAVGWRLEARRPGGGDPIVCTQPDLITTVLDAIYWAEARGWHQAPDGKPVRT